jgi:hypothetical protein
MRSLCFVKEFAAVLAFYGLILDFLSAVGAFFRLSVRFA